jgi:hypothetical protein
LRHDLETINKRLKALQTIASGGLGAGHCGGRRTFYLGNMNGVGRQALGSQDADTPITAADLLNDQALPLFELHAAKLLRLPADWDGSFELTER